MMRRLALAVLVAGALLACAGPAQARELEMTSMEVDLRVGEDGVLHVEERMDVRFTGFYNGIFRFIPYADLRTAGFRRSLALRVDAVEDGQGNGLEYWSSRKNGNLVLKIRVPGAKNATRRVVVRYRALNVILGYDAEASPFGGHDELYWNVVGTGWQFPIRTVRVSVRLPASLASLASDRFRTRSWRGLYAEDRSGTENALQRGEDGVFRGEAGPFGPGQALTIAVAFPPGHVDHPGTWMRVLWFLQVNWFLFIPLVLLVLWFWIWWRWGRDSLGRRTIIPEYEPPEGLRSAAVGVLLDERLDHRDVTAAIVDLAVRGVITIDVTTKKRRLLLDREKLEQADLDRFDRDLIEGLFGDEKTSIALSSLKYKFVSTLSALRGLAERDLVKRGYWRKAPRSVNAMWFGITFVTVLAAGALGFAFGLGYVIAVGVCAIPMLVLASNMSKRSRKGLDALARIKGMQEYMVTAERERMQALPMEMFERLLPYAIAFGVHDRWLKAFADLFTRPPDWYATDAGRFGWAHLNRSINGMDRDVSKNLYSGPRPAKTSGGSGGWGGGWSGGSGFSGGSSGGGFGGGGGGGW